MKKISACPLFLLLSLATLWSQSAPTDKERMEEMVNRSIRYAVADTDSALLLANQCIALAQQLDASDFESRAEYAKGVALKNRSEFQLAEAAYQRCISIARAIPDSLLVADGLFGLGTLKRHQGDYPTSINLLNQSLSIREKNQAQDTELARTYNGIANVLYTIGKYRDAIGYYRQALHIHQRTPGREGFAASTQVNIGGLFVQEKEPDSAFVYLEPAMAYYREVDNPTGIGAVGINIAEAHLLRGNVEAAQQLASVAVEEFRTIKDLAREGMALNTLANIARESGDYQQAIRYSRESLHIAQQVGRPDNVRDQYLALAENQTRAGLWEDAFNNYRTYTEIKDSLFNEIVDARIQEEQQRFDGFLKDQEIADLRERQEAQNRERKWLITGLALLGLLCLIIIIILQSRHQTLQQLRQEQQTTQALLEEKEELLRGLENAQVQLIQNEKMASLGQLTAGIAHEINNPINFITSSLAALKLDFNDLKQLLDAIHLLKEEPENSAHVQHLLSLSEQVDSPYIAKEVTELIEGMESGAERTLHIVTGLRTFSRNTSEYFHPADINEGIESTLLLLRGNLPAGADIQTDFDGLPPVVCQISRLNQVFLNIINNAVQAIQDQGQVHISTKDRQDGSVRISVRDNGMGMDEETANRIFEPFFTTKDVGKGTGLGLSISYGIIHQHEGQIEVESELGKGSLFTITLPVKPSGAIED